MRLFFCFLFLTVPVFSWAGTAASQITEGAGEEPVLPAEVKATPVLVSFYKIDWPEGEKQFVRRVTKDFMHYLLKVPGIKLMLAPPGGYLIPEGNGRVLELRVKILGKQKLKVTFEWHDPAKKALIASKEFTTVEQNVLFEIKENLKIPE